MTKTIKTIVIGSICIRLYVFKSYDIDYNYYDIIANGDVAAEGCDTIVNGCKTVYGVEIDTHKTRDWTDDDGFDFGEEVREPVPVVYRTLFDSRADALEYIKTITNVM